MFYPQGNIVQFIYRVRTGRGEWIICRINYTGASLHAGYTGASLHAGYTGASLHAGYTGASLHAGYTGASLHAGYTPAQAIYIRIKKPLIVLLKTDR